MKNSDANEKINEKYFNWIRSAEQVMEKYFDWAENPFNSRSVI
jgi:hypothetical protein